MTKQKIAFIVISFLLMSVTPVMAQEATAQKAQTEAAAAVALDTSAIDTTSLLLDEAVAEMDDSTAVADGGAYTQLKKKFTDGGVWFMSLVALCLIIGLAFCIERIIYLTLSEIDAKKFMVRLEEKLKTEGVEAAKDLCRNTRGPIASICYQGLLRIDSSMEEVERSVSSYASVQVGKMEKGCSWITLFIAMAPSLGFLGTVIGMVMAFDQIEIAGDIGPTIVASGMKVALITTIFGIIVALILQLFYNYVLSKIDHLTAQMEESAITLMDIIKSCGGK